MGQNSGWLLFAILATVAGICLVVIGTITVAVETAVVGLLCLLLAMRLVRRASEE
jgi:1,4-dihydroxy-2-naphthoate octaprenyltransferase